MACLICLEPPPPLLLAKVFGGASLQASIPPVLGPHTSLSPQATTSTSSLLLLSPLSTSPPIQYPSLRLRHLPSLVILNRPLAFHFSRSPRHPGSRCGSPVPTARTRLLSLLAPVFSATRQAPKSSQHHHSAIPLTSGPASRIPLPCEASGLPCRPGSTHNPMPRASFAPPGSPRRQTCSLHLPGSTLPILSCLLTRDLELHRRCFTSSLLWLFIGNHRVGQRCPAACICPWLAHKPFQPPQHTSRHLFRTSTYASSVWPSPYISESAAFFSS